MVLVAGAVDVSEIVLCSPNECCAAPIDAPLEIGKVLVGAGQVGVDVKQRPWVFNRFGDLAGALQVLHRLSMLPTVVIEAARCEAMA